jgi:serine/threonine-protein kinase PknG
LGDTTSSYGTVGFQAPEISSVNGPTVASDLYTVGRTLAVLCTDFVGYQTTHRYALRSPADEPLYAEFDSLYRFLERATAVDPDDRYADAREMAGQLEGVLREVVATRTGEPAPGRSTMFAAPRRTSTGSPTRRALPAPAVDPSDPAAGVIQSVAHLRPEDALRAVEDEPPGREIGLWRTRTSIDAGELDRAAAVLDDVERDDPYEWRAWWYRGILALAGDDPAGAERWFDAVYRTLPGELAPKLALGLASEMAGRHGAAARWYDIVSRTDPSQVAATFGLARCRVALDERDAAVAAFARVPETSSAHVESCVAAVELLLDGGSSPPSAGDIVRAASIAESVDPGDEHAGGLRTDVLRAAFDVLWVDGAELTMPPIILGVSVAERDLRVALEDAYRTLARRATSTHQRVALVDEANAIRPRSLL